jgi:hypothetical protein
LFNDLIQRSVFSWGVIFVMTTRHYFWILALLASCNLVAAANAQEVAKPETDSLDAPADAPSVDQVEPWYYRSPETSPKKTMPQLKAEYQAQQRMARLAAQQWYGFSNARPTVAALPFTSMYRPAWQGPGGKPYRWHRPIVVIVR